MPTTPDRPESPTRSARDRAPFLQLFLRAKEKLAAMHARKDAADTPAFTASHPADDAGLSPAPRSQFTAPQQSVRIW